MPVNLTLKLRRPLGGQVDQLIFIPEEPVTYRAGQFLELLMPGESDLYFTIASAPGRDIELHVDASPDNMGANVLMERIEQAGSVEAEVGGGECHLGNLPDDDSPLLLIASGTGFSQIKAITEALLAQGTQRPIHLYWSARSAPGLYMAELAQGWADTHEHVHFSAVISELQTWDSGRHHLHACITEDLNDLSGFSAVCCGSPDMVHSTLDYLAQYGLDASRFHSDMLQFAPRPA